MEGEYTDISNGSAAVRVRKIRTRNGVRLEVYAPEEDRRVYLDPLMLESLAWQTPETFAETLEDPPEDASTAEVTEEQVEAEEEYTELTNEFALTFVRKVRARNEPRLEIISPRLSYQIFLDAPLLQSLTRQTPATFSRFLEEPYGPRGGHH